MQTARVSKLGFHSQDYGFNIKVFNIINFHMIGSWLKSKTEVKDGSPVKDDREKVNGWNPKLFSQEAPY